MLLNLLKLSDNYNITSQRHEKSLFFLTFWLTAFMSAVFPQSLLWKVSGKNMKAPSYLYGTIHIQDERVFSFDNTVYNALFSCDAFAMEVLLDEVDPVQMHECMMMPKGQYLSIYRRAGFI